jgi:hypothetical protein
MAAFADPRMFLPYEEGFRAGLQSDDALCPYWPSSPDAVEWQLGFEAAQQQLSTQARGNG